MRKNACLCFYKKKKKCVFCLNPSSSQNCDFLKTYPCSARSIVEGCPGLNPGNYPPSPSVGSPVCTRTLTLRGDPRVYFLEGEVEVNIVAFRFSFLLITFSNVVCKNIIFPVIRPSFTD